MYGFNSDRSKVEVPKIYTSSTAPQAGSAGDLWLKTEHILVGEAYAVYDSSDGSLTIFRDEVGKYTDGQVVDTKTYYAGIEDITGNTNPKWYSKKSSVTKVVIEDTFRPKTAYRMFDYMSNLTEIDGMENLDTSECINMDSMFWTCTNLTSLDLSNFDTSNVENMYSMFSGCNNLTSLNVNRFDTSKVTNMGYMFFGCNNLTATLNIMKMPSNYNSMCYDAAKNSGQLTLKYISPVTSADIDTLVATKGSGNVVNGGPA